MFYVAVAIVAMSSASAMFTSCDKFFGGKDNDTTIVESNVIPDDSLNASNDDSLKAATAEAAPAPAEKAVNK